MPTIKIDGKPIEMPEGTTILDAARALGIDIPTLCYFKGYEPNTSCLVCMVKLAGSQRLVPSCGTKVIDGMEVESETKEVHDVRRTALELLFSDHVGDCQAPCLFMCPAHMDIPLMLRQIKEENLSDAIVTVKNDIALPAVLGRVCPKPCEKGCRRGSADNPVAICTLKRHVADADLATGRPFMPQCKPATGRRVAVVGAGPTGLSAAYYLMRSGHAVTLLDNQERAGGRLLHETNEEELPRDVLAAEIDTIVGLGAELRLGTTVGENLSLAELRQQHDAVFVACGAIGKEGVERLGLKAGPRGIHIDRATYATNVDGIFAGGNAIRTKGLVVRSVADGKEAAESIDQLLAKLTVEGPAKVFSSKIGRVSEQEMNDFMSLADRTERKEPAAPDGSYQTIEAISAADRCMHCDCRALASCRLKFYAEMYAADTTRFKGERAGFQQDVRHGAVIFESGKCINCGLCIQIAARAEEPLGLTFVGRGFDVRVGVPLDRSMEESLGKVAEECIRACPTAALSFKNGKLESQLPILGHY